jgi:hypothetical protein
MQRGEDGGEGAAERVPGEHGRRLAGLFRDRLQCGQRQALGVFGQPAVVVFGSGVEPLQQIHPQAAAQGVADHADPGQQVPDVGALDRRGDDQHHRPGRRGRTGRLVGAEPREAGHHGSDAERRLDRVEADHGAERASDLPAGRVDKQSIGGACGRRHRTS